MITRRFALPAVLASAAVALQACSASSGKPASAQILDDVGLALTRLDNVAKLLSLTVPPIITTNQAASISDSIHQAQALVASVTSATPVPTAATALGVVEGYLNSILSTLASMTLPSPYNLAVMAASIVAQELEGYIHSVAPLSTAPAARIARAAAPGMSIEKARAILAQ